MCTLQNMLTNMNDPLLSYPKEIRNSIHRCYVTPLVVRVTCNTVGCTCHAYHGWMYVLRVTQLAVPVNYNTANCTCHVQHSWLYVSHKSPTPYSDGVYASETVDKYERPLTQLPKGKR